MNLFGAAMLSYGAYAAETKPAVEEVIVTGYADRQLLLDAETRTGSRLGLTVRETPAIIDVLTEAKIQELGARTSIEALIAIYEGAALPLTFSVGARHGGHFYTNNANTIRVAGHTVVDASIGYQAMGGDFTLRGRNLSDELYADWSGSSATQVNIGAPRSFDVTFVRRFN